jgi:hypothetical protein
LSSSTRIGEPLETLSPTLSLISFTTPAFGDGISIVALSDSSVMSDCSLVDSIARLDQYFDDFHLLEVADVRNNDLAHTFVGSAFSGSMPYFLIASATVFAFTSPWSASALSAAMATKQRFTSKK